MTISEEEKVKKEDIIADKMWICKMILKSKTIKRNIKWKRNLSCHLNKTAIILFINYDIYTMLFEFQQRF